jgi:hypothetical protein
MTTDGTYNIRILRTSIEAARYAHSPSATPTGSLGPGPLASDGFFPCGPESQKTLTFPYITRQSHLSTHCVKRDTVNKTTAPVDLGFTSNQA